MGHHSMGLSNWLSRRFRAAPGYECPLCSLRFDAERTNCPACGYTELRHA